MPYIKPEQRAEFERERAHGAYLTPSTPGDLNYLITDLCTRYLELHKTNYQTMNDIVGALECAKQEFYRRVVAKS